MLHKVLTNRNILLAIFVIAAIAASLLSLSGTKTYEEGGRVYNRYNNYTIFERSFDHLIDHQDLYVLYPEEHWDLYKYTPTFSVFFGLFSVLPDWLGLCLWNILNALILGIAIFYLPVFTSLQKGFIMMIVFLELFGSMQHEQSNAMIAGLIVLAFGLMERNKIGWATLAIVFSGFIKLFGIVGFALFLFYPGKWRTALYSIAWIIVLLLVPLLFVGMDQYIALYKSFANMLANDHDASYGFSVMGILHSWFSIEVNKNLIVGLGVLGFLIPLARFNMYSDFRFKVLTLCSILLWIVIFNHKAEGPTFIIAITGIAIWFMLSEKNWLNVSLFVLSILLISISPTDIFPKGVREEFILPYVLKALPCVLVWLKIIYDCLVMKKEIPASTLKSELSLTT